MKFLNWLDIFNFFLRWTVYGVKETFFGFLIWFWKFRSLDKSFFCQFDFHFSFKKPDSEYRMKPTKNVTKPVRVKFSENFSVSRDSIWTPKLWHQESLSQKRSLKISPKQTLKTCHKAIQFFFNRRINFPATNYVPFS